MKKKEWTINEILLYLGAGKDKKRRTELLDEFSGLFKIIDEAYKN